jgi:hypothetical protein
VRIKFKKKLSVEKANLMQNWTLKIGRVNEALTQLNIHFYSFEKLAVTIRFNRI